MEKEKIGTKATRAEIINTLYKRNYITNFVRASQQNQSISNNQDNHSVSSSNNLTLAVSHPPSSIASSSSSSLGLPIHFIPLLQLPLPPHQQIQAPQKNRVNQKLPPLLSTTAQALDRPI